MLGRHGAAPRPNRGISVRRPEPSAEQRPGGGVELTATFRLAVVSARRPRLVTVPARGEVSGEPPGALTAGGGGGGGRRVQRHLSMSRHGWEKKRANASHDNGWAEQGGYMAAKVSKLEEQFKRDAPREKQKEGSYSDIFSGVSIYVNGYTEPSADELRRLMMLHGGHFHVYYSRSKTTHIIANNLPNFKIQELKGEKIIRPQWITDSVKAGRLLPHLQYQLYTKHSGPLFPGASLRQTSDVAGPSHGPLQLSVRQRLNLPQRSVRPSVPNRKESTSSWQNNSIPNSSHSPLHQGNDQPQSVQQSAAVGFSKPRPSRTPSAFLNAGPRHRSLHSEPSPTEAHQSALQTPPANLQQQRASQAQPQSNSFCNAARSGHKEVDSKINGILQTSLELISHPKANEMHECGRGDPFPPVVKEAHLTNGHAHLVNGALKPEDSSPATDGPSVEKGLRQREVRSPDDTPQSPREQFQTKPDPYEFPHSPPRQSDPRPVFPKPSNAHVANEQRPEPSPPTYHGAAGTESQCPPTQPHQPRPVGSDPDQAPLSPAPRVLSHSPVRLNGSHHNAFSSDPASCDATSASAKPAPPSENPPPASKASAQLLAQTGSLISEYYSHSRLHQISTWRSCFSEYVNELHGKRKAVGGGSFPGKDRLRRCVAPHSADSRGTSAPASVKSCVLHVDMDCFFVSVGIRYRPELKGKPVAVTSNRGQESVSLRPGARPQLELQYYQRKCTHPDPAESPDGHANGAQQDAATLSMAEIASCSYEARKAGVKNGMFFGKAKQLCPSLQSVPYDFEAYKEVAVTMYETLAGYTHDIEALSCDEVLIDGSAVLAELSINPEDLARAIRAEVKEKTGCCASVGMGSNILLARLATRKAKPDGQYLLKSEEVDDFIRDLPVTSLPGVGPVMGRKLAGMGVRSCGDLQQASLSQLQKKFGPRTGQTLFRFCRGLDDRPVRYEKERKSVSAEMNYNIRFAEISAAEAADHNAHRENVSSTTGPSSVPSERPLSSPEPVPGTSRDLQPCRQTPKHSRARLDFSIEVPSPSQVDRSVLEALPAELREQVERSWSDRDARSSNHRLPSTRPSAPPSPPSPPAPGGALPAAPAGTLFLQIPNQPDSLGIVLELPNFSQVDPDVFAALPKELQAELKSAYNRVTNVQPQGKISEQKNPLLQLKQSGRTKRRYKRKNAVSPVKKGPSPVKRRYTTNSPGKAPQPPTNTLKAENGPCASTSKPEVAEDPSKLIPRPAPVLAGAYDLTDIKTLLREWVTTITEPMEEDILQVVKYCTELIEDKDLEKLDLIIKYMKRLMQEAVESVWSMAFDFILDNVQVVVQQAYGSTLKVA
ncbi:DNA repair protein REV1 isoform 7-T7 [Spinachia spinachia]